MTSSPGGGFGRAVSLSGDKLAVGAEVEDGYPSPLSWAGAAHVFERIGSSWVHRARLTARNRDKDDRFGFALSLSGDTLAVGAYYEASAATGIDGDESDNSARMAGAGYLY